MAYRVFWHVPQQILCLELEGDLTLDDFNQINRAVNDHLGRDDGAERRIALVIDITRPGKTPQAFAQLQASQTYAERRDLKFIFVAGRNKFMRLMVMLTFNLCRQGLRFFENMDQALAVAQRSTPALK